MNENDRPATLRCSGCKRDLPATAEFFHRSRTIPRGFAWRCKPCAPQTVYKNEHYLASRTPCPKCGKPKTRTSAHCKNCTERVYARGDKNHNWNGGRRLENGYVILYRPGHPRAKGGHKGAKCYVSEHTIVMETKIGRHLLTGENVHHLNGNRADNRPENLELWACHQPKGARSTDLVRYAVEILTRYAPDILK